MNEIRSVVAKLKQQDIDSKEIRINEYTNKALPLLLTPTTYLPIELYEKGKS